MSAPIYLDYNASAPLRPAARAAFVDALDVTGNPSSVHRFGRDARRLVEQARGILADRLGVRPERVVFTSGATEANATALTGVGRPDRFAGASEHDSVLAVGAVETFGVDGDGVADLADLGRRLSGRGAQAVVALQLVNGETGVVQPVADAAALVHAHGALMQCDAAQAFGRLDVSPDRLGADLLTVSSHKIGGPKGVGALVVRDGLPLEPLIGGGGQERRRRAGTENVPAIAGFGAAAAAFDVEEWTEVAHLRDRLERQIKAISSETEIFGRRAPRIGNTSCIAMAGIGSETQLMAFDLAGIAVSAGSACSSGKVAASHVLKAMGVCEALAQCAIRVSLGPDIGPNGIDRFVAAWQQIWLRRHGAGRAVA